jgi:hypothetical protein
MNLYLDIETLPAQRPDVLEEIRESCKAELAAALEAITCPGNYKDPAKIAEWHATTRLDKVTALKDAHESNIEAAYRRTGLDGAFGQVCVIGWALEDDAPNTIEDADDEGHLLRGFAHVLRAIPPSELHSTTVVGHNVSAFDLRFLAQRSIVRGIRPHQIIARAAQAKPWESEKVFDTMVQWSGVGKSISLDRLCKALSIPSPKGELDGSKVWDFVRDGRINEVAKYCAGDVAAVRAVHQRMTFRTPVVAEVLEDVPA